MATHDGEANRIRRRSIGEPQPEDADRHLGERITLERITERYIALLVDAHPDMALRLMFPPPEEEGKLRGKHARF